ncbi:MAG TPA: GNAT family N-acetyltransferase [Coleofasciculaceae cyanobacterium]|jgi:predicted acetyltransferase
MNFQLEYGTLSNPRESQRLGDILCQCFNESVSDWQFYLNSLGQENFRVIRRAGDVAGGLAILQMNQWFGSEPIPMAGIASVGVPPEHRGMGVAVDLLSHTLRELYAKGVPLSTLYAATQRPYRKVGYEQAGTCCRFELPIESIRVDVSQTLGKEIRSIPMQPVSPNPERFQNLYRQWAIKNNGNLDRNQVMWQLLVQPQGEEVVYAYLIGSEAQPEGYVIFSQKRTVVDYDLWIRDWVALTPIAARRLWLFIADHRSQAQKVLWRGSVIDPLLLLLSEQSQQVRHLERWLLRVVDVSKALEKRGYPVEVETQLHLEVWDDLLPENKGRFILRVSEGRGEVTRGGRGELQLDVRGLAPLFTGLLTPYQLQLTGQIKASDSAVAVATQLFSGSEPWMPDKF